MQRRQNTKYKRLHFIFIKKKMHDKKYAPQMRRVEAFLSEQDFNVFY